MVTERNSNTEHDFLTDPIRFRTVPKTKSKKNNDDDQDSRRDDELWIKATGTTLGADNGIGVAAALALLEEATATSTTTDTVEFPPLILLFTVDEETGLTGAQQLDAVALGLTSRNETTTRLLNLDTEEWGELYVGCAGGGESILTLPLSRQAQQRPDDTTVPPPHVLVRLVVRGLLGGHSGVNIHEGRANAILLCAAAVRAVLAATTTIDDKVRLVSLQGGDKHNAIPREATAVLALATKQDRNKVEDIVQQSLAAARAEYGLLETNLDMSVEDYHNSDDDDDDATTTTPLEHDSATRLVALLLSLPHGPLKYSHAMKDLVETSNNVASIAMISGQESDVAASIMCSSRSSVDSALEAVRHRLAATATLAGATVHQTEAYPGWNPNPQSPLLGIAKDILKRQNNGREPGVKAIHAGLECGLLMKKLGGPVDALSFGPTITGAHSPDESILTDTVPPFYQLVKDILVELAKREKEDA